MPTPDAAGAIPLPNAGRRLLRQDKYAPYFFISPFYILFALFFLFPSVFALILGFLKWNSMGTPEWFALRNYERLFSDETFWLGCRQHHLLRRR